MKFTITIEDSNAAALLRQLGAVLANYNSGENLNHSIERTEPAAPVVQAAPPAMPVETPAPVAMPVAAAPTPPAPAAEPAGDYRDVNNMPWDDRIHSGARSLTQDGAWRRKKGVSDDIVAAVEAELKARMVQTAPAAMPVEQPAPPVQAAPAPIPPMPVEQPVPAVPMAPVAPPPAFVPPMPVEQPVPAVPAPVAMPAPPVADPLSMLGIMQLLGPKLQSGAVTIDNLAQCAALLGQRLQRSIASITDVDGDAIGLHTLHAILTEQKYI